MEDGTVYAGISPETHKAMYTTPDDAPLTCTFNEARKYAAGLDAHGHHDWRVPTRRELNVLWGNRNEGALKGTFNGSHTADWHWSSSKYYNCYAWVQRFSDGRQLYNYNYVDLSLRCVR